MARKFGYSQCAPFKKNGLCNDKIDIIEEEEVIFSGLAKEICPVTCAGT